MSETHTWRVPAIAGVAVAALVVIGIGIYRSSKSQGTPRPAPRAHTPTEDPLEDGVKEDAPLEAVLHTADPLEILAENGGPPALAMVYIPDAKDFDLAGLNRPPRAADNPTAPPDTNSNYYNVMRQSYSPSDFMAEADFHQLQALGLIPRDFPPERIVVVPSHSGLNKFMVGYSAPYTQQTSATSTQVVSPLWAVSFYGPLDTSMVPADDMDDMDLRKFGAKMLFGEGMLERDNDGCHKSQGLNECDAEKAALMSILLERIRLKRSKTDSSATAVTPFTGAGQQWNASSAFMNKFNQALTPVAQQRFNDFYNNRFWHMPKFGDTATHFIHHFAVKSVPAWIQSASARTPTTDAPSYANQHAVRIGRAIVADNSRTFS